MATEQIPTTLIADDAVTTAKVADDAITGALIENNPTVAGNLSVGGTAAVTGAFTASGGIANAGAISAGSISSSVTGFTGPKVADVWRLNTEFQGTANPITNLTRATNANDGSIGSAMTTPAHGQTNAGVFTFPMTGIYQISFRSLHKISEANLNLTYAGTCINKVISGSVLSLVQSYFARAATSSSGTFYYINYCNIIFDCTDTTTDKVSFATNDLSSSSVYTLASTTANSCAMFFTRIGDT